MKKFIFISAALFAAVTCGYNDPLADYTDPSKAVIPPDGTSIKIMTYNIYGARGLYKDEEFGYLADVINAQNPDVVFLNEVDSATTRSRGTVHFEELARKTNMHGTYAVAFYKNPGAYGDAILSKYPFLETRDFQMDPDPAQGTQDAEVRSVCAAKIEKNGTPIWLASTHLDHRSAELSRIYQANLLKEIVAGIDGHLFVGGDMNAKPTSMTMGIMFEYLQKCYLDDSQLTFPSKYNGVENPHSMIDYITFRYPDPAIKCTGYTVIQTSAADIASDHYPVVATFRIND